MDHSNDNQVPLASAIEHYIETVLVNPPKFDPNKAYTLEEVLQAGRFPKPEKMPDGTLVLDLSKL